MVQPDKSALRRKFLQQRQSLSSLEWQATSRMICDRLQTSTIFEEAQTILAYFSFRREVDLTPLFELNKSWAFPRCVDKSLVWHSWEPADSLQTGKYGILEPQTKAKIIDPATADLILVPTIACDRRGYRLGYGGGFYDRLLSSQSDVPTIGVVFDFAYVTLLPIDPWDMPLNFVCTENRFDIY